ncbi:hypothetical protein B0H19DRAFT_1120351 [Mycena capillaripes]|nr:hypothetical protein B0H19DRAFT_1120351 [Mycena capillaripes]
MASSSTASFTSLGRHAYIQRSSAANTTGSSSDPTVIIILGWMSAKLSHLHKYTAMYREIYPGATIILIRSPLSFWWTFNLKRYFAPVIEALEALQCLDNRQRILTHTFSNGGTFHLVALAGMVSSKTPNIEASRLPSALIIDSSPGGVGLDKMVQAVASPIRNPFVQVLASVALALLFCFMWLIGNLVGRPNPVRTMMNALRNPRVLPWIDERSPRLYLYSKADVMVPWAEVEAHAKRSASDGLDVRRWCFDKSGHVAHARVYPQQYWAAVKNLWADACQAPT